MSFSLPPGARIAVIGAGVSGLVATKRLAAEGFVVTLYERRKHIGGLWNYSKEPESAANSESRFASAVYDGLDTNFPRQLMELQDHPHETQPLFMPHDRVLKYLKDYSKNILGDDLRLMSDKEVIDLYYEKTNLETGVWHLTSKDMSTGLELERDYAGVIVAVGMFDRPYIPDYKGLEQWQTRWPEHMSHAKTYRKAKFFADKKVLIVGYQASGFDLARNIASSAAELYISSRRDISNQVPDGVVTVPEISRLESKNRQVFFEDDTRLWRVDHILFCTGYIFSQPFIKAAPRASTPMFPDGPTIDNLWEHMVYKDNPSLAFVGIVQGGAPTFLVAQAQVAYLSRLWAGRLSMGQPAKLKSEEAIEDNARHLIPYPQFMDYLLRLEKTCEDADQGAKRTEKNLPFKWTLELDWIRQNRREIREAFMQMESESTNKLADLGFSVKCLTPSSQNIARVVPFLILHAAYFPNRQLSLLKRLFLEPKSQTEYHGTVIFDQIKNVVQAMETQVRPESRALIREGAMRIVEFGLGRLEMAVAQIDGPDKQTPAQPSKATTDGVDKAAVTDTPRTTVSLLREHQRKMKEIFAEIVGDT